ncbi:Spy/CpxP family protein refolding chaperone [Mesoterricola silvestris]|uniref:Uncharacterized protein n=1 Tax=Mesoterricola silvestris TaxID=2927979 RepID=A0AA48GU98_9BACT|nr:Spy/CpxP family protein refolding chaperone [Mesoterricola silvestris]BDU71896.1 hypothetical protein METEAL_10700 [Mesoterricola silvestris]
MKNPFSTLSRTLCAGALALAVLPALAAGGRGPCGTAGGGACGTPRGGVCANLPGVTEAQKTAFAALQAKHRPAMEEKCKAARDAHDALRQAMAKPDTDRAALKALFDKESQARFALLEMRQAHRQEMAKLLTPEQKAVWEKRCADGPGMGRGQGCADGPAMGKGRDCATGMKGGRHHGQGACPQGVR